MSPGALDEFTARDPSASVGDRVFARATTHLANRTTRRSVLATIGRGTVALMGAGYLGLWRTESAWAACAVNKGECEGCRLTCMCSEITGSNSCPNCKGSFWTSCITNPNDPAACAVFCPDTRNYFFNKVKLYDCCAKCSGSCDRSKPGCSGFGNDYCCNAGYCSECCGANPPWVVKCVVKTCTTTLCSGSCP